MQMYKVAVYGSLRKTLGNHSLLKGSKLLSTETIEIPHRMLSMGGFPGLVPSDNTHDIVIEVYEVTNETLRNLNMLEGYYRDNDRNNFYNREIVNTSVGEAYIYVLNRGEESSFDKAKWVDSGDWLEYKTEKSLTV